MKSIEITHPYTIKIIGEAGDGIISAGDMLLCALYSYGLFASAYREFPSNIRGGVTASIVRLAPAPVIAPVAMIDCLFPPTLESLISEIPHCREGCSVIIDDTHITESEASTLLALKQRNDIIILTIPQQADHASRSRCFSSHLLGQSGALLNLPLCHLHDAVRKQFSVKKPSLIDENLTVVASSYEWALSMLPSSRAPLPTPCFEQSSYRITDGNECIGYGAIASSCSFFSSYPITPATSIGTFLAMKLPEYGGVAYQAEDEIAAIGAAIGASFSGARSLTATSGPGLSLMQECIGYASMAELPVVIIDVQRGGPSTGSPTQSGQEDLFAATFGSHGESPRIVLAPIGTEDCFFTTCEAFSCTEHYQCPVILLSDRILGLTRSIVPVAHDRNRNEIVRKFYHRHTPQTTQTDNRLETAIHPGTQNRSVSTEYLNNFKRYELSEQGINMMPVPGVSPVAYCATGLEHDEYGYPTDSSEMRTQQQQRRYRKLETLESEYSTLMQWDNDSSPVNLAVIAWGSSVTSTQEAIHLLRAKGVSVAALFPRLLFPICTQSINKLLSLTGKIIIIESNYSGQYAKLVRMYTDAKPISITSTSGTPFNPEYLFSEITAQLRIWYNEGRR